MTPYNNESLSNLPTSFKRVGYLMVKQANESV